MTALYTYDVIAADPPWPERGGGKIKRGADKHYEVLTRSQILEVMLRAPCWRPSSSSHLYMWTTMASLLDAAWVMDGLGFRYVTHAVWVKADPPPADDDFGGPAEELSPTDMSMGQYFRGEHEVVLFGTRGRGYDVRTEDNSIRSVIYARVPRGSNGKRVHSRKPEKFFELVERRSTGTKLEMFGRGEPRPGWSIWGNEAV